MELLCVAVFDVKSEAYNTPFFVPTKGVALRGFADMANNKETWIGAHPEDYRLDSLGKIDVQNGCFVVERETLGWAQDFVVRPTAIKGVA